MGRTKLVIVVWLQFLSQNSKSVWNLDDSKCLQNMTIKLYHRTTFSSLQKGIIWSKLQP